MRKCWLNNLTVIISGASGGLGFSIAKYLIEKHDCKIIGIARNEEKIKKSIETLGDKKDNFSYFLFDVNVKENWINFKNSLVEKGIIPDVLINNAGFMLRFAKFHKYSDEEVEEILNTNLISYINATKILLPLLIKSKSPAIINVSSSAGLCPVVGESMYCATKYALTGFTEVLRQDYKKQIYVAGVYPGFVKTDILNRMEVSDKNNKLINKLMLPLDKATKRICKRIKRKKVRIITGVDGKSMAFFVRLMPKKAPSIVSKVLKTSKLELFNEAFDYKEKK